MLAVSAALAGGAVAQGSGSTPLAGTYLETKPLKGEYFEFSGALGEQGPPSRSDAKVSLHITGKLATDMFRYLGRSARIPNCASDQTGETRARRDLECYSDGKSGAECYVGIDMVKGHSTGGVIC